MTARERYLYHQIHPLKLATDIAAGFGALYPLWRHEFLLALCVLMVPPVIASVLVLRFADLDKLRRSAFGRYVALYMTHGMEALRLLGMLVMMLGAWLHSAPLI